jgi:putative DNA methylase
MADIMDKRKLIEVSLPLEAINRESTRENYIYRGNPSAIHKWWSQKPFATARAVLFAQLVDDPSARPDEYPTEELQRKERERLHSLIERLVVWENISDKKLLAEAQSEIMKSTNGNPPPLLDPFAGGGTIPLEAQRLGLEAHAYDLNPVAVLISKALIELPPKFRNRAPVFPGLAQSQIRQWAGAEGLAADVQAYGDWIRQEAATRLVKIYPKIGGSDAIAWIWVRTVHCPNPACGIEMPLTTKWWLSRRKGRETYFKPSVVIDKSHRSGRRVNYTIQHGLANSPAKDDKGTVGRAGARCIACEAMVDLKYIRAEGACGRLGHRQVAVVVPGTRLREYVEPDAAQVAAAVVPRPSNVPDQEMPKQALSFRVQAYGMTEWSNLFTNRQLTALATFSDLVGESRQRVIQDGAGSDYADAIATYLAFVVSKLADYVNSLSAWYPQEDRPTHLFTSQAIPMMWDYAELNPLSDVGGAWSRSVKIVSESLVGVPANGLADAAQANALLVPTVGHLISTDPPYYNSIGYSDLSDFFYVWLRRSLREVYPDLLSTMLVPKADELVANPFRHDGQSGAKDFFEVSFREVFSRFRETALDGYPITVYYAHKQSETDATGEASSGWETLLEAMIRSGWEITSTWPMRSERGGRMISVGTNALASSIVLSLRPRAAGALTTDRRGFIASLEAELPDALRKLQQGQIAPVDLPQAAVGPGMAVFSRYGAVLEPDGKKMTVRAALARINEILDQVLNEQEGDFDSTSRFAIAWYRNQGYGAGKFGNADDLARARNTSVDIMERDGIVKSRGGVVQLIKPEELSWDYDVIADIHTSNWEALHHVIKTLARDGIAPAGDFLRGALNRPDNAVDADLLKELAYLLFRVAESNGWTNDALSFNNLVTSWPEILDVARARKRPESVQAGFMFSDDD